MGCQVWRSRQQQEMDGAAVDVFSFGLVLFCMLHGCDLWRRKPREQCDLDEWRGRESDPDLRWCGPHIVGLRPSMDLLRRLSAQPRCPRESCQVIWGCCVGDPQDRLKLQSIKESVFFKALTIADEQVPKMCWEALQQLPL